MFLSLWADHGKCLEIVSTPCTLFDILGLHTTHKLREILPNSCLFPVYHTLQSRCITCHPELSLYLV